MHTWLLATEQMNKGYGEQGPAQAFTVCRKSQGWQLSAESFPRYKPLGASAKEQYTGRQVEVRISLLPAGTVAKHIGFHRQGGLLYGHR